MGHFRKTGTDTLQREPHTGRFKLGHMWLIPKNAEKPIDGRTKRGKGAKKMKSYKIVIIEDEELIREELKTLLVNAGYVVDCVINFAKTIDYIKSAFPDLILLDINLPEQDGYRRFDRLSGSFPQPDFIHYRT